MQIHPVWTPETGRKPNVPLKFNTLHFKRDLEKWLKSLAETKVFKILVNMDTEKTGMITPLLMFQLSCKFRTMVSRQRETPGQVADSRPWLW